MSAAEKCIACGRLRGTGTLADMAPDPPRVPAASGMDQDTWRVFAKRYRCPMCANAFTAAVLRGTDE